MPQLDIRHVFGQIDVRKTHSISMIGNLSRPKKLVPVFNAHSSFEYFHKLHVNMISDIFHVGT